MRQGVVALQLASVEADPPLPRVGPKPILVEAAVTPETPLKFAMCSWVTPTSGPSIFVTQQVHVGGRTTVSGVTGTGKRASAVLASPKDLLPRWAVRVAALMRVAFDTQFDPVIKGIIAQAGLPVDPTINWDLALNRMWIKQGVWPSDDERREDSIQEAIVTVLVVRDTLKRWDPTRAQPKEGQEVLPMAQKLTGHLLQWFLYYCTENGGARHKSQVLRKELGVDPTGLGPALSEDRAQNLWEALLPANDPTPEDAALADTDHQDLRSTLDHFLAFVKRTRPPKQAENIATLIQIVQQDPTGAEVMAQWTAQGFSESYLRSTLNALRDALRAYRGRSDAQPSRFLDLLRAIPDAAAKAPKPSAPVSSDALTEASALEETAPHPFIAHVIATLQDVLSRRDKTAKPEIVQESVVYVRLRANEADPRFMDISFYAPGAAARVEGGDAYKVEVGDWETDRGLNEGRIRKQLSTLVFPAMRLDVLDDQRALLEKVIARLRTIVWENAVDYFQVPLGEKAGWQNVIKMDVQKIQDLRVHVRDKEMGHAVTLVATLHEGSVGRKSARSAAGEQNLTPAEQTDFAPDPTKTAGAPGAAYETSDGAVVCRACAKKDGGAPTFAKTHMSDAEVQGKTCSRCFTTLGKPVTAGRQEPEALAAGKQVFDPDFHGPEDEPALTWLAKALKDQGLKDDADNVSAATEGFIAARDAHFKPTPKESSMSTKFAALKRIAAEDPQAFNEAIDYMKGKLSDGINNLTVLQENLGAVTLDESGENPQPVEGEAKFAAFKRIAAEEPELLEEALGEFYGSMDEVMSMTENLADQCDIDLPTPGAPDEEAPAEEAPAEDAPETDDKSE